MSRFAEELADQLARDALAAVEETGDERLLDEIARAIGTSSPTTEELFRTSVRVRQAERRARALLDQKLAKAKTAPPQGS